MARVLASRCSTALGLKNGNKMRRASVWNGGSDVMGGATSVVEASAGPGRTPTSRDEKLSVS